VVVVVVVVVTVVVVAAAALAVPVLEQPSVLITARGSAC
jgi:hypothetical protein